MRFRVAVGLRVAVFVLIVAAFVVGAAVMPGLLLPEQRIGEAPAHPAWNTSELAPERLETGGTPAPDGNVGTVVFDRAHSNRFDREDVSPLTDAIVRAGGVVEFTGAFANLTAALSEADVFVIVDPATGYSTEEVATVQEFVSDGGRVVMFGEPNRKSIQVTGVSAGLVTYRSHLTEVGSTFGISFGTGYLYDMQVNDGGFKNVVTTPGTRTDSQLVEGIDRVALHTATTVRVNSGQVLLRTVSSAELDGRSASNGFPVAVVTRNGRVLAVGDKSFIADDKASIADNEVLVERIVEFMAGAG